MALLYRCVFCDAPCDGSIQYTGSLTKEELRAEHVHVAKNRVASPDEKSKNFPNKVAEGKVGAKKKANNSNAAKKTGGNVDLSGDKSADLTEKHAKFVGPTRDKKPYDVAEFPRNGPAQQRNWQHQRPNHQPNLNGNIPHQHGPPSMSRGNFQPPRMNNWNNRNGAAQNKVNGKKESGNSNANKKNDGKADPGVDKMASLFEKQIMVTKLDYDKNKSFLDRITYEMAKAPRNEPYQQRNWQLPRTHVQPNSLGNYNPHQYGASNASRGNHQPSQMKNRNSNWNDKRTRSNQVSGPLVESPTSTPKTPENGGSVSKLHKYYGKYGATY